MTDNWRIRFYTVWTGQAFSQLGSQVVSFALIWWLTEEAQSGAVLATASLMTLLPPVFLGPFAGALVDRWSRRRVMIVSDASIALVTAVLAVLFWRGIAAPWHIYGIILVRAIGASFHWPAMMASTTLMVPNESLPKVAGMNQTLGGILRIASPPLGAVLLRFLPIHGILSIDIVTALMAILPLLFVPIPQPAREAGPKRAWALVHEMADGLRYVLKHRALFSVVGSCTLANVFLGPTSAFLPLLVTRDFGGTAMQLGFVTSAAGIGVIAGGLVITAWGGFHRRLFTSALGWIGIGIPYMAVLAIPGRSLFLLVAAMFLAGLSVPIGCAPLEAWYQTCVPPDKQGRVFSVLGSIDRLTMPLGLVLGGLVAQAVPLRLWWGLVGLSHALLGLSWLLLPIIRQAEDGSGHTTDASAAEATHP